VGESETVKTEADASADTPADTTVAEARPDGPAHLSEPLTIFIQGLIVANIVALTLESEPMIFARGWLFFTIFETVSVGVFTLEYLWRVSHYRPTPGRSRLRFALSGMMLIDLLAILPFYLLAVPFYTSWSGIDLRFLRAVRLLRLLRVFKLARYSRALRLIGRVVYAKKEELLIALILVAMTVVMGACMMHFAESKAQPELFGSILMSMWWVTVGVTKVDYLQGGPMTALGQAFGIMLALVRIGILAFPTAILVSGFMQELERDREENAAAKDKDKDKDKDEKTDERPDEESGGAPKPQDSPPVSRPKGTGGDLPILDSNNST
jgi:voltage-gated potassium channel